MASPSPASQSNKTASRPAPSDSLDWTGIILTAVAIVAAVVILQLPEVSGGWQQRYDPMGHWVLSTIIASLPVLVLLGALAFGHVKAHYAALAGLITALLVAVFGFGMPARMAASTAVYGTAYGLFPIGWIVLNVIFLYQLTVQAGRFEVLKHSLTGITQDRRLQLLLIAFSFGAFFEGAAGFGTPVAVTAALLIGLGFRPLQASGLSLIANTAPVAYGALGTPIVALAGVTGFSEITLGAMAGRILPWFSVIVPFWLIWAFVGFSEMVEIWPAILVAGASFATSQYFVSNHHGPWLVDVISAIISMACLIGFLMVWHPKRVWTFEGEAAKTDHRASHGYGRGEVTRAWLPWLVLSIIVFCWGTVTGKKIMNTPEKVFTSMATWTTPPSKITSPAFPVHGLNKLVERVPPVVLKNAKEPAVFTLNWVSATGSGILVAGNNFRTHHGLQSRRDFQGIFEDHHARKIFIADDRGDDGDRLSHAIRGSRRHYGPRLRANRPLLSVLRDIAWLAGRCAYRVRYLVQRPVRQPAENLGAAGGRLTHTYGGCQ